MACVGNGYNNCEWKVFSEAESAIGKGGNRKGWLELIGILEKGNK